MSGAKKIREIGGGRTRQTERDEFDRVPFRAPWQPWEYALWPMVPLACLGLAIFFAVAVGPPCVIDGELYLGKAPFKTECPVATERGRQKARGAT